MTKQIRGFALLSKEDRIKNGRRGGKAVPAEKRAFFTDRELAARSGAKGGRMAKPENRYFYKNRKAAKESGRKGGLA